jgi:transcriptional regulator with XRE-family HTH domain
MIALKKVAASTASGDGSHSFAFLDPHRWPRFRVVNEPPGIDVKHASEGHGGFNTWLPPTGEDHAERLGVDARLSSDCTLVVQLRQAMQLLKGRHRILRWTIHAHWEITTTHGDMQATQLRMNVPRPIHAILSRYSRAVKLAEKLSRLTEGKNRAQGARDAGIRPTVLNNYINRGSEPMGRAALGLADALDVPIGWLLNDGADWPPPASGRAANDPTAFTDDELMLEVCRRYRLIAVRLDAELKRAAAVDWFEIGKALLAHAPGEEIPEELRRVAALPGSIAQLVSSLSDYDPSVRSAGFHNKLPGRHLGSEELEFKSLRDRRLDLWEHVLGFAQVQQYFGFWNKPSYRTDRHSNDEVWRAKFSDDLAWAYATFQKTGSAGQRSGRPMRPEVAQAALDSMMATEPPPPPAKPRKLPLSKRPAPKKKPRQPRSAGH